MASRAANTQHFGASMDRAEVDIGGRLVDASAVASPELLHRAHLSRLFGPTATSAIDP